MKREKRNSIEFNETSKAKFIDTRASRNQWQHSYNPDDITIFGMCSRSVMYMCMLYL